jgi:Zn ribbon nucleic-acid-binding protein
MIEESKKTNSSFYEAFVFCVNCHNREKMSIPKGSRIEDTNCENCGNMSLKIDPNGEIFNRGSNKIDFV